MDLCQDFLFYMERSINVDFTGQKFGMLTVLKLSDKKSIRAGRIWDCVCDCGNFYETVSAKLKSGHSKNCGCVYKSKLHGHSKTLLYAVWRGLKDRCSNPNYPGFEHYGGRGITVCDSWENSFQNFLTDMGSTYKKGLTLDRKNVNGNYEPDNCRWATLIEQARNKRTNHLIETPWGLITLAEAAEKSGIPVGIIKNRVGYGWKDSEVLKEVNKYNEGPIQTPWGLLSIKEAAEKAGMNLKTLQGRICRNWPKERLFEIVIKRNYSR
jgi:hypothetical protein